MDQILTDLPPPLDHGLAIALVLAAFLILLIIIGAELK
jgi:hypothetical protein